MAYKVVDRFPQHASIDPESQIGYIFKLAAGKQCVAVATQDRALRLIDLETMKLVSQINSSHGSTITDLQHIPNTADSGFISASQDGTCKVWDLRLNQAIVTIKLSNDTLHAPVFSACVSSTSAPTCAASCGSTYARETSAAARAADPTGAPIG